MFTYCLKLDFVWCSIEVLGTWKAGDGKGTETEGISNCNRNKAQETSTMNRMNRMVEHRKKDSPNGCFTLLVALAHFLGSDMSLTMVDIHLIVNFLILGFQSVDGLVKPFDRTK